MYLNKMKNIGRYIKKGITTTFLAGSLYTGFFTGLQVVMNVKSPRINTKSQLESRLVEERRNLHEMIGDATISAILSTNGNDTPYAEKIGKRKYKIVLSKRNANVSILRHELYHIAKGHLEYQEKIQEKIGEGLQSYLIYLFWFEPQATIYEVISGLKP